MINSLDDLAKLYYNMHVDALKNGAQVYADLYIELMKYTKHLEQILKSDD